MAFGFLKKIAAAIFGGGKKSSPPKGGAAKKGRRHGGNKHSKGASQQNTQGSRQQAQPFKQKNSKKQKPSRPHDERSQRKSGQTDRRHGYGGSSVNTAANEMRPGGEFSRSELERNRIAHEKWDASTFQVESQEGKKRFHDFDLPSEVMHGISDLGFKYCTEIQALSLEQALSGRDIAGKAQTGSGKTAAFLVAILTRYLRSPENRASKGGVPRALVIAPTRELVIQICKDAHAIGKYSGLKSLAIYGGMDYDRQKREVLSSPVDLLVATPGRLLDFVRSHVIDLSKVDTLVIDEADRMLEMGFIPDVRRIISNLPAKDKRTTMLYSATLDEAVMRLALNWMNEPYKAEVESQTNATDTVKQVVYVIQAKHKFTVLYNHIALHPTSRTIVFCNRKSTTEDVYESLKVRGVSVEMLSGDVNQNKRLKVLDEFRDGKVNVVVATDVAGRGLDVKGLEYVVNFDFPYEAEDYVHRIGRTGRAGSTGVAISFADEFESCQIPDIESYIKETLKCTVIGPDDPLLKPVPARHSKLGAVDQAALAEVDAREAVGEEEKAAAAALVGANAVTGSGAPAILKTNAPKRELPTFANACEEEKPRVDETNVYMQPVAQQEKLEEWQLTQESNN